VSGPRDEIDAWLDREVELLPPAPGTFERVHRQARRRKRRQALLAAAGAVVIIAGLAAAPQIAAAFSQHGPRPPGQSVAAGRSRSQSPAARPATSAPAASPGTGPAATAPAQAGGTALSATTSGAAAPGSFRPTSITMIGGGVGAVLGQAGTPGHCAGPVPAACTSLAGTSDWGASWYGVSAPVTSGPDGALGVSQVRFLNLEDGWAFGPQLYVTTDGGLHWSAAQTYGMRVIDLEVAGNRAFAIFAFCSGGGPDFAANCTTFALYSAPAGSAVFQPVPLPGDGRIGANGNRSASLVIGSDSANPEAGTGYLLTPSGYILSGPLTGAAWKMTGSATPCPADPAQPGGQPSDGLLAAGPALLISCGKSVWSSADGGASWKPAGIAPAAGTATSLTTAGSSQVILATTAGIDYSADGGKTWQPATIASGAPAGGFSYVGMTTATHGMALPADASLGEVFITSDGGTTWSPHPISGS